MGRSSGGGGRSSAASSSPTTVTKASVETAYNNRVRGLDPRVAIADIKEELGVESNTELHRTLRELQQDGRVSLRGIEDPTEITPRIRAAGIDLGADDFAIGGRDLRVFVLFR